MKAIGIDKEEMKVEETTAIAKTDGHSAISNLMPQNFSEVLRFGEMLSKSKLVPEHLQGKPDDCGLVVIQAVRWGMDPLAVAQKTHLVSGTVGYEAQLVNSVISASRVTKERIQYDFYGDWSKVIGNTAEKEGKYGKYRVLASTPKDELGCGVKVWATLKGEEKPRVLDLLLTQALTRNSTLWASDPKQQLAYLAVKKWARLHIPEVMLGVYTVDELEDRQPVDGGEVVPEPVQKPMLAPIGEDLSESDTPGTPKEPESVPAEPIMSEEDKKALWVIAKENGAKTKDDVISFSMTALGYPAGADFRLDEMTAAQFEEVKKFYQEQG